MTDKRVALKWMLQPASDASARRRFVREARAAGRVQHPNVVDVYDVGQVNGCGYLVMELLHGKSLRARLASGALGVSEAIALLLPALRGVASVHRAGVIHRDLKPDNIFLCEDADGRAREAKVLDFGISAISGFNPADPTLTLDGAVAGTPAYMAPERLEARGVDERSDVYSLGVVLYEVLTHRLPFVAETFASLVLAIVRDAPEPPIALRPDIPPALNAIILKAMAKQPEQRFATVEQLIRALESCSSAAASTRRSFALASGQRTMLACTLGLCVLGASAALLSHRNASPVPVAPETGRAAVMQAEASPFDTPTRYLTGAACSECLDAHCAAESDACSADAACKAILEHARQSPQPLIADREYLAQLFDGRWDYDQKRSRWMKARETLVSCARRDCVGACNIGRDFACAGQFSWPASYPETATLRLHLVPLDDPALVLANWSVRACARGTQCERLMGHATTDRDGFATLTLDFSSIRPNTQRLSEFDGTLELDGGPEFFPQSIRQSAPFLDRWYKRYLITTREQLQASRAPRRLATPDKTRGVLLVQPIDCGYWNAWGLTLEVWKYDPAGYQLCTDCVVGYPDDTGIPDATLHEWKATNSSPAEVGLPPIEVALVVRDTHTHRLLSALTRIDVRANHENGVVLFPVSREQLASLPRELVIDGRPF